MCISSCRNWTKSTAFYVGFTEQILVSDRRQDLQFHRAAPMEHNHEKYKKTTENRLTWHESPTNLNGSTSDKQLLNAMIQVE